MVAFGREHFYLIWPFAVLLLARVEPRWRMAGLFGVDWLATAWRIFEYESLGWAATYFRADTRLSGLICGALLAICSREWAESQKRLPTASAFGLRRARCLPVARLLARAVDFGVAGEPGADGRRGLAHRSLGTKLVGKQGIVGAALVGIGVISYGLYLWHYPAAVFFRELLPWYQMAPIVLIFAFAAAIASYMTVERPRTGIAGFSECAGGGSTPSQNQRETIARRCS